MPTHLSLTAMTAFAALTLAPPPASAAPRTHAVVIDKMKFGAVPEGVRVGDRLLWINKDLFRHSATAKDGSFDLDLPAGASRSTLVKKPGALVVLCRYHPGMRTVVSIAK